MCFSLRRSAIELKEVNVYAKGAYKHNGRSAIELKEKKDPPQGTLDLVEEDLL